MAVRLTNENNHVQYGTVTYTVDSSSELSTVPTNHTPGSLCFCIETSKLYILNTQGQWIEKPQGGGGGGGGGSEYPSADSKSFPTGNDNVTYKTQSLYYNDIARALIEKTGVVSGSYTPAQMDDIISSLTWTGTQEEYDAIVQKNPFTLYMIVEEEE
jgi:hypothetical protein